MKKKAKPTKPWTDKMDETENTYSPFSYSA